MSSSKPEQEVLQHFNHIHPLKLVTSGPFKCNGCNLLDSGKTYYCAKCDYHLHDHCASCPPTLLSYMHPQHELQLVFKGPEHYCDICTKSVQGLYYRCNACDFDAHAVCALLTEGLEPRHSKRERAARFLKNVGLGVVSNIIASPISDILKQMF